MHELIRADILNHISHNLHNPIPGSGGNIFYQLISAGIDQELIRILGSPPTTYSSVEQYLQFMSQPHTYATHIELMAATQLYGVEFRITLDGSPYPQAPPAANICDLLYHPNSEHYSTLRYSDS